MISDGEIRELQNALGMRLTRCTGSGEYHNEHFRGTTPAGVPMFVKVLDDVGYYQRAVQAAPLAHALAGPTPRLLDHGRHQAGWWLMYAWRDLAAFTPTPEMIRRAGALLGSWHHATSGMHLTGDFQLHDLDEELGSRSGALRAVDPSAADRVDALRARWGPADLDGPITAIHGDVHWRNFGIDRASGELWWYDWENASSGPAVLDFAKLVDLGLADPAARDAFLDGYHEHAGVVFPWPAAMRYVRLWHAAGVLVYARTRGLVGFAAHGEEILSAVERL